MSEPNCNFSIRCDADLIVSRWQRQQRGVFYNPSAPVTETEFQFAQELIRVSDIIDDQNFEIMALRNQLPQIAPVITKEEWEDLKKLGDSDLPPNILKYHGYSGNFARVFIDSTDDIENKALSGDADSMYMIHLLCNARTHEIIRLSQLIDGKKWDMSDQSADAVIDRGIVGANYSVLLADVSEEFEKSLNGDILALSSLTTTLQIRSSEIMELADVLRKKGTEYRLTEENLSDFSLK